MDTIRKSLLAMYTLGMVLVGGIISTFLGGTLVVKLQGGLTTEALGSLMAIAGLPWVLKPLWGGLIDKFKSTYWWAMAASAAVSFSVLGLAEVDTKTSYWLVVALVLLPNILRSLQDVAVDALAISASREDQRGAIQMWMRVGTIIGSLLGGAGAMWLSKKIPWKECAWYWWEFRFSSVSCSLPSWQTSKSAKALQ
jgi:MFS family permease